MTRALTRLAAAALVAVALATSVAAVVFAGIADILGVDDVLAIVGALGTACVGAVIVTSRAGNRLGWVFLGTGVLLSALPFVDSYMAYLAERDAEPHVWIAWIAEWWWLPMLFFALVFWLFLFPDGHLPGRRWRFPFGFAVTACAVATVFAALDPVLDYNDAYELSNPIGIDGLGDVEAGVSGAVLPLVFVACVLAAAASLVVRFRRARGLERQQIKWITLAGVLLVAGFLVIAPAVEAITGTNPNWLYSLLFALVPAAVGVAILRHGLFDVDLVIRRTIVYGALTVLLGAAYAGLVLAGQALLASFAGGGDLAIAGSTLVIAAVFLPLRARVQRFVDRRFYRRRYDARRTLDEFGTRLRDQVELDGLRADLEGVVRETMQPAYVSVWLRERASR